VTLWLHNKALSATQLNELK